MYDQTEMNQSSFMNEILTPKLENISVLSVTVNNDSIKNFPTHKTDVCSVREIFSRIYLTKVGTVLSLLNKFNS
jgi:mannitol-specific phosphotransferase system IIBC component